MTYTLSDINTYLKDKNILVVYGGWEDHQPQLFAEKIASWLREKKANRAPQASRCVN